MNVLTSNSRGRQEASIHGQRDARDEAGPLVVEGLPVHQITEKGGDFQVSGGRTPVSRGKIRAGTDPLSLLTPGAAEGGQELHCRRLTSPP